jgi:DnaA N-terminal domain
MSISKHKTAISSTNRSFSTTGSLSLAEQDKEFLRLTTQYSYSEPGNIIPHFWFKKIVDNKGRVDLTAITLLSEILALYRFSNSATSCSSYLAKRACDKTTLIDKTLRTSYEQFTEKFFFSKEKTRRGFLRLEELGIITRGVCNISLEKGGRCNKLMITIDQEFFLSCFRQPELDIRAHKSGLPYSLDDKEVIDNYSTGEDSENNVISSNDNKFQSLQISYHHISNKNRIKKDRSMIYASGEAQSGSSFLEKSLALEEKENSNFIEISSNANVNLNPDNQCYSQVKNPSIYKKPRKLSDFYPLNKEDCSQLQSLSDRDFSLNAMNEILRDMSKRLTDRLFNSRKGFLSYMSKAFAYEMRDAVKTSNESFKIKANLSSEESRAEEVENYLTEIEYSTQVSPEWHLKKKLAGVLESAKAYSLLKAYRSITIEGDIAKIYLHKPVQLSQGEREQVLSQVKATHERFENGIYTPIQKIELIMPKRANKNLIQNKTNLKTQQIPNTLWGNIRKQLVTFYGEAIDIRWFSKIDATEDTEEKAINLKASSEFIKDWIERNYEQAIEQTATAMGIKIRGLEC